MLKRSFDLARLRTWLAIAIATTVLFALGAVVACTDDATTTVVPTTGILIRAETLTTGRGCGTGPTELFKYAVVVFGYTEDPPNLPIDARTSYRQAVTANVFDCFTDGEFISLPPSVRTGNTSFRLEVYAYTQPVYAAFQAKIESAGTDTSSLKLTTPTWTTECTASQSTEVETLALCDPLSAGLTAFGGTVDKTEITLGTGTFHLPDGRTATCAAGTDAGTPIDSGNTTPVDAGDAGDAGAGGADADVEASAPVVVDSGAPVLFTTARIRYRTPLEVGPTVDVTCPTAYVAEVPSEPANYTIDVGLLDPNGVPIGGASDQIECTATSKTGTTSTASCE